MRGLLDTPQGYGLASKVLHWVGGLMVLLLFGVGTAVWFTSGSDGAHLHHRLSALHIALGGLFALPLLVRVLWRLSSLWGGRQPSPVSSQAWMRRLEQAVRFGLLTTLVVLVVSGPLLRWWSGHPIELFGGWYIPNPFEDNKLLRGYTRAIHQRTWQVMAVLLILHIGGALLHRRLSWQRMRWFERKLNTPP
jgi:cytochrome b561